MGNDGKFTRLAYASMVDKKDYRTKSASQIFKSHLIEEMNPSGVSIRESRDSEMHPVSTAIMIWLDVTGSMHQIPTYLVKESLADMMETMMNAGIANPQIHFGAIGDHTCDSAPLQISQFESSTQKLDKWLTSVYMEGGGGGNDGESYMLSWFFAGHHTAIDCFEKRGQKGFLFTIGDEKCLSSIPGHKLNDLMGKGQYDDMNASELLSNAQKLYNVFHIHIEHSPQSSRPEVKNGWKELLGDNCIIVQNQESVGRVIGEMVARGAGTIEMSTRPVEVIVDDNTAL